MEARDHLGQAPGCLACHPAIMATVRRRQWIEIHEQDWCPPVVRDAVTEFLRFTIALLGLYRCAGGVIARQLDAAGDGRLVDLCSGSGGPWPGLIADVRAALPEHTLQVTLTDKYPRRLADLPAGLAYHPQAIDALATPAGLAGHRTMFSSFHHFPPAAAQRLLRQVDEGGHGLLVFEFTGRRCGHFFNALASPLAVLLFTPFMRGWTWRRLVLTYLVPLIPLVVGWDALVSNLRTYNPAEIRCLCRRSGIAAARLTSGQEHLRRYAFTISWFGIEPAIQGRGRKGVSSKGSSTSS